MNTKKKPVNVRYMTMTAMLSAIAFVLMMLEFSIPIMPSFIKLDFSELPALIGSFAMGPLSGTVICLIKNLLHLPMSSTGGVGDTTTLVVAPLVAACGGTVAKMSGRGLAHSGGTLDKLESVPGVCVEQPLERFKQIVRDIGLCVIGQSADLDPADKRMYALRDVSGTVKSIPLIASSIMSKKLASGTDAIVLDVKTGNGAFMEKIEEAVELASEMVAIGKNMNKRTVALITDMSRPLGMAVGNGLEMREAIQVLRGEVPVDDQLVRVCFSLAGNMLKLSGLTDSVETAVPKLQAAIKSGAALNKLREMIERLGGDTSYIDEPDKLVNTRRIVPVLAPR